jgi:hypothetical protein
LKIHGDIRESRCTARINDTDGKFATGVNDTDGEFATGVNYTGGKEEGSGQWTVDIYCMDNFFKKPKNTLY